MNNMQVYKSQWMHNKMQARIGNARVNMILWTWNSRFKSKLNVVLCCDVKKIVKNVKILMSMCRCYFCLKYWGLMKFSRVKMHDWAMIFQFNTQGSDWDFIICTEMWKVH